MLGGLVDVVGPPCLLHVLALRAAPQLRRSLAARLPWRSLSVCWLPVAASGVAPLRARHPLLPLITAPPTLLLSRLRCGLWLQRLLHVLVLRRGPLARAHALLCLKTVARRVWRSLAACALAGLALAAARPYARRLLLLPAACVTLPLSRLRRGLPLLGGYVVLPLDVPCVEIATEVLCSRAPRSAALPAECVLTSRRPAKRARPTSGGRGGVRPGPGRAAFCLALACRLAAWRLGLRARLGDVLLHRRVDRLQLLLRVGQQPRRCVRLL